MPPESVLTGYLSAEELKDSPGLPTEKRRRQGPEAAVDIDEVRFQP